MPKGEESSKPVKVTQQAETKVAPDRNRPGSSHQDQQYEQTTPAPPGKWNATAQRLLEAAHRLLVRSGFNALSLERIAREADVNKPLIFYYFGNKAGLLRALMDLVLEEDAERLRLVYAGLPEGEARVHAVVEHCRKTAADRGTNQIFFDTAANMLRHTRDRERLAEWCETCRELNSWGLSGDQAPQSTEDIGPLSAMTLALLDGIGLQMLAAPGAVDAERIWELWEEFLCMAMKAAH